MEYSGKKVFWYLISFVVIFSGFYVYFVNGAIINVLERQKTEQEIISINSQISDMELSYLDLNNQINIDYAFSLGFVKVEKEKYVYRKALKPNLTLN